MSLPEAVAGRAAETVELDGVPVPGNFGDPAGEYEAARNLVALAHRPDRTLVAFSGEDRRKFLQGLLTNDIEGIPPGGGRAALFLDTKGHVRGALDIWAEEEALIVGCDVGFVETALPDLARYVLAADVHIEDRREVDSVFAILGAAAAELLRRSGVDVPAAARAHARITLGGAAVRLARTPDLGVDGLEIHVPRGSADDVCRALEKLGDDGVTYIGWQTVEALRVEHGAARFGRELTGNEFPQEAGLDAAVDYEKGCYLGQETVARIHYRGQVNRLLSGLRSASPLPRGAELVSSEREIGRVTSVAESPRFGAIALGYVRRDEAESGATLDVRTENGVVEARVVTLPFAD